MDDALVVQEVHGQCDLPGPQKSLLQRRAAAAEGRRHVPVVVIINNILIITVIVSVVVSRNTCVFRRVVKDLRL